MRYFLKIIILFLMINLQLHAENVGSVPAFSEEITKHLEYMGYQCNISGNRIVAKHKSKLGFDLFEKKDGLVLQAWFPKTKYAVEEFPLFLQLINTLNRESSANRYYLDADNDLVVEAWYPGQYERKSFTVFISTWEQDFFNSLAKHKKEMSKFIN